MANCIYCGLPAEMFQKSHLDCEELKKSCNTQEEFRVAVAERRQRRTQVEVAINANRAAARLPGTQWTIMWGVFKGMWLFAASMMVLGLILGIIRLVLGV